LRTERALARSIIRGHVRRSQDAGYRIMEGMFIPIHACGRRVAAPRSHRQGRVFGLRFPQRQNDFIGRVALRACDTGAKYSRVIELYMNEGREGGVGRTDLWRCRGAKMFEVPCCSVAVAVREISRSACRYENFQREQFSGQSRLYDWTTTASDRDDQTTTSAPQRAGENQARVYQSPVPISSRTRAGEERLLSSCL